MPWTRFGRRKLLFAHAYILTWFWAVLLATGVICACRLSVGFIGHFSTKLHSQYLRNQPECRKSRHWSRASHVQNYVIVGLVLLRFYKFYLLQLSNLNSLRVFALILSLMFLCWSIMKRQHRKSWMKLCQMNTKLQQWRSHHHRHRCLSLTTMVMKDSSSRRSCNTSFIEKRLSF